MPNLLIEVDGLYYDFAKIIAIGVANNTIFAIVNDQKSTFDKLPQSVYDFFKKNNYIKEAFLKKKKRIKNFLTK